MNNQITLDIYTPDKKAIHKIIYGVVLPYGKTNLTIINNRAPTSLLLHQGLLKILDENKKIIETYFIDGGVVDVANNICKISTFRIINISDINKEKALELREQEMHNKDFYQMIVNYFNGYTGL